MSHHGKTESPITESPIPEELTRSITEQQKKLYELGATGEFPDGKLTEDDEGSINFAIGIKDGKVCLDFGTPSRWIAMKPEDALKLAETLIEKARKAAKHQGSILTLNL